MTSGIVANSVGHPSANSVSQPEKAEQHSRVPKSVLRDKTLTPCDRIVYAELAMHVWQGRISVISTRTIASNLGISRPQVQESLRKLVEKGHVARAVGRIRRTQAYSLLSNVFARKQGRQDATVRGKSGVPRFVSMDNERHGLPLKEDCA